VFDGGWELGEEVLDAERSIKTHKDGASLSTLSIEVVYGLSSSDAAGTHEDNSFSRVWGTIVLKDFIVAACDLFAGLESLDEVVFNLVVVSIVSLRSLEPYWWSLAGTDSLWVLWVHGLVTEGLDLSMWNEWLNPVIVEHFNLLDGVRGSESVECVDDWVLTLDGSEVGNNSEIHCFLHVWGDDDSYSCLTNGHDV
jgi:hypothetical protein